MTTTTQQQEFKAIVPMTFTQQQIKDLLCCGMEGGIGYWAVIVAYEPEGVCDQDDVEFPHLDVPFLDGGCIIMQVTDSGPDETPESLVLDREALQRGSQVMAEKYPRHMASLVNDNTDSETGDVFIQCCVLGEIIYS